MGTTFSACDTLSLMLCQKTVDLAVDAFHCNLEAIEAARLRHILHHHHILLVLQVLVCLQHSRCRLGPFELGKSENVTDSSLGMRLQLTTGKSRGKSHHYCGKLVISQSVENKFLAGIYLITLVIVTQQMTT